MNDKVKAFAWQPAFPSIAPGNLGQPQIFIGGSRYEQTFNHVLGSVLKSCDLAASAKDLDKVIDTAIAASIEITDKAMIALNGKLNGEANVSASNLLVKK